MEAISMSSTSDSFAPPAQHAGIDESRTMDIDMDMDIDLQADAGDLEAEAMTLEAEGESQNMDQMTNADAASDPQEIVPNKLHLRGLDSLHTNDIRQFAEEHFPTFKPVSIEWIDDTSANAVYETTEIAQEALFALSLYPESGLGPLELRQAKALSSHGDQRLEVRTAIACDKKLPRARERSRYYLFHPEHDPSERRKRDRSHLSGSADGDYRRRKYDDREERRRRDMEDHSGFDASFYDDDAGIKGKNGRRRRLSDSEPGRRSGRTIELFPDRVEGNGAVRARSKSPRGNGTIQNDQDQDKLRSSHFRQREYRRRSTSPNTVTGNKELFPGKSQRQGHSPAPLSPNTPNKELFPQRLALSAHRRSDAFDASGRPPSPFGASRAPGASNNVAGDLEIKGRSFADRISKAPTDYDGAASGMSIRGAAAGGDAQQGDMSGFAIRGAAGLAPVELFPNKLGSNAGKELFGGKLEGRGGRRRKAEDLFG